MGQPWQQGHTAWGPCCPAWETARDNLQVALLFSSPAVLSPQVGLIWLWERLAHHGLRFPFVSEALSPFAP